MNHVCIFCGELKEQSELSEEHIWPSALGGDSLPSLWRTNQVCRRCNSMSGIFVDGEFIKGIAGTIEAYSGVNFVDLANPSAALFPLAYLGKFKNITIQDGQQAEYWAGPCGANVIHIRPADREPIWSTYAGGDPRRQRQGGRVYLGFTSKDPFWVTATLRSVLSHFKRQLPIYVINASLPRELVKTFREPDPDDEQQSKDLVTVREAINTTKHGEYHQMQITVAVDTGSRFLAKVALAIGHNIYGPSFLTTSYAQRLRQAFREADPQRREKIPIHGVGYFASNQWPESIPRLLSFPGVWVLSILSIDALASVVVATPSGSVLCARVSDDTGLVPITEYRLDLGVVWIVVPTLGKAIGPIAMPDYLAHQSGVHSNDELAALEAKRVNKDELPVC